jgi:small subunit ribosomal protein S2
MKRIEEKFMPKTPTLLELLKAGVHFGHTSSKWHPNMKPFIFGQRSGVHIVDLEQTVVKLGKALDFVKKLASEGKVLLFVGTKEQGKEIVKKYAEKCEMPYVDQRWLGGTFTNFLTIKKVTQKLINLKTKREEGELKKYTKKEQLVFDREIAKLEETVGGIQNMKKLPEAVFILDLKKEKTSRREAEQKKVQIVAICDTNINPDGIDYCIPGNDDAIKSIELIVSLVAEAVNEGKKEVASEESVEEENKKITISI